MLPVNLHTTKLTFGCIRWFSSTPVAERHLKTAGTNGRKIDLSKLDEIESLPQKPKKPPTPYLLFANERLKSLSGDTVAKMSPVLSLEWRTMDRSKYVDIYQRRYDEYRKNLDSYHESLSGDNVKYLELRQRLVRQHNAFCELGKVRPFPKNPRNPANFYYKERYESPEIREQLDRKGLKETSSFVAEEYRDLSPEQKQKYLDKAEQDRIRYEDELDSWYKGVCEDLTLRKSVRQQAEAYYQSTKARLAKHKA